MRFKILRIPFDCDWCRRTEDACKEAYSSDPKAVNKCMFGHGLLLQQKNTFRENPRETNGEDVGNSNFELTRFLEIS